MVASALRRWRHGIGVILKCLQNTKADFVMAVFNKKSWVWGLAYTLGSEQGGIR